MSNWFKELPCPLHPSWGLEDISELDLRQLKNNVDTDSNGTMVVETKLYRAFLEYPCGRFYNQSRANPIEALKYLQSAKDQIRAKFKGDLEAEIGYGIITHTFHMRIKANKETEIFLQDLVDKRDKHPNHQAYIHIVQAYFLSRLGPCWRNKALLLYESALERYPNSYEWLFGKALMLGREARQMGAMKGYKRENGHDVLQKEKHVLERIVNLEPKFHLARAYYGQVLYFLDEHGAGTEISRALSKEPQNRSIAMVAVRYHRRNKQFRWAEMILEKLLETSNTAEVNHQLGLLYVGEASCVQISKRFALWRKALHYFNKGVDFNVCHFPCYTKRAEMHALLGETSRAYELFKELFDHIYKDSSHLYQNEILTIETALEMRLPRHLQVFQTEEIVELSHRYITLATMQDEFDDKNRKVKKRLEKLEQISCSIDTEDRVRKLASLRLADAHRLLKNYKKAEKLYEQLYRQDIPLSYKAEIALGLGKCYFRQGFRDKAIAMARKLERMDQSLVNSSELYADVYLQRAKFEMKSGNTPHAGNVPLSNFVLRNLELAIDNKSLEATYVFLTFVSTLKEDFFGLELRVPQVLAKIKLVCQDTARPNVHTQFTVTLDDGTEVVQDEAIKTAIIERRINELLTYETSNDTNDPRNVLFNELKELRESRFQFELELLKRNNKESWNTSCGKSLRSVIQILRELLDHAISYYKESVLKDTSENCSFPVKFQDELGNVNKERAKKMINDWIVETFDGKLPNETFRTILEVQPMYDKDNVWLAALNELNNKLKHKNKVLYALENFDLTLKKHRKTSRKTGASKAADANPSLRLKSEDVVRRSCKEVERLVLYFLSRREDPAVSAVGKKVTGKEDDEDLCLASMFSESS